LAFWPVADLDRGTWSKCRRRFDHSNEVSDSPSALSYNAKSAVDVIKNKSVLETQLYETNVGWTVEVIGSDHGVMRPIMLFDTAVPISEARCEFDAAVVSVLVPA
jgi:N-acetylmuramoyl-L-alanine amidase CwlA